MRSTRDPDRSIPSAASCCSAGAGAAAIVGLSVAGWRRFGVTPALAADAAPKAISKSRTPTPNGARC